MATRRLLFLFVVFLAPTRSGADGHRTEAAATYSALFGAGSTADGLGASVSVPFCWLTPDDKDCETNKLSFLVAYSGGLTAEHPEPTGTGDVKVQYLLAGVRRSHSTKWKRLSLFEHLLVGGVRRREARTPERFGDWGSGGAATGTFGVELILLRQPGEAPQGDHIHDPRWDIRLRGQWGFALYGIGDDTRFGAGYAAALSFGWEVH